MTSDGGPEMSFVQYDLPPLESGDFIITVTQTVDVAGTQEAVYQAQQQFDVTGPRYTLPGGTVHSVFPPAGNQGEFSDNLAHVVLKAPTLPWQRQPGDATIEPGGPAATWLAVLVFDQDDPPPSPQNVTVADLASAGTMFMPFQVLEDAQSGGDPVTVIDISTDLFNAVAPTLTDLDWCAHTREVEITSKAIHGHAVPPLRYGVVFGNRLPIAGHVATAHLVSLEGFGPYLPLDDGSSQLSSGYETVRLVTLYSWTFTAIDEQQSFQGLLDNVSREALQLPYDPPTTTTDADSAVQDAFGTGYTALNHTLRNGSTTVSWYRGPLLPLGTTVGVLDAQAPWSSPDQLVLYDPDSGMFDESYAAAWQLGRLLALHDSAFAVSLYSWTLTETQKQVAALEQELFDERLPPVVTQTDRDAVAWWLRAGKPGLGGGTPPGDDTPSVDDARRARMAAVIERLVAPAAEWIAAHNPVAPDPAPLPSPARSLPTALRELLTAPAAPDGAVAAGVRAAASDPQPGTEVAHVIDWLTKLHLLEGVPFNYLVPDIGMLPVESIRFFQVDNNWLEALLDGAYSIGFNPVGQSAAAQARPAFMRAAAEGAHRGRHRRAKLGEIKLPPVEGSAPEILSGLLLRSAVVSGWPGLEVFGTSPSGDPLRIVRMQTVAPALLLVIFSGVIAQVTVQEPSEAVHFGVDSADASSCTKDLRYATSGGGFDVGSFIANTSVTIDQRVSDLASVIPLADLAAAMADQVWAPGAAGTFTAAQFGLEMVEGVQTVTFDLKGTT